MRESSEHKHSVSHSATPVHCRENAHHVACFPLHEAAHRQVECSCCSKHENKWQLRRGHHPITSRVSLTGVHSWHRGWSTRLEAIFRDQSLEGASPRNHDLAQRLPGPIWETTGLGSFYHPCSLIQGLLAAWALRTHFLLLLPQNDSVSPFFHQHLISPTRFRASSALFEIFASQFALLHPVVARHTLSHPGACLRHD